MKRPLLLPLALLAACATAPPPPSSSAPSTAVDPTSRAVLGESVRLMRENGYTLDGAFRGGSLDQGEVGRVALELDGGQAYFIVGACDQDCSDLDFALAGPDGTNVDSDYEPDDVPMVAVDGARGGTYRLTVSMASCSVEPCGYGVAVFVRQ